MPLSRLIRCLVSPHCLLSSMCVCVCLLYILIKFPPDLLGVRYRYLLFNSRLTVDQDRLGVLVHGTTGRTMDGRTMALDLLSLEAHQINLTTASCSSLGLGTFDGSSFHGRLYFRSCAFWQTFVIKRRSSQGLEQGGERSFLPPSESHAVGKGTLHHAGRRPGAATHSCIHPLPVSTVSSTGGSETTEMSVMVVPMERGDALLVVRAAGLTECGREQALG